MSDSLETSAEIAKATQEVAKATAKSIEAAREAGGFIAKYVNGPLEQGMAIFEDKLKYIRWERQVDFMLKADRKLKALGLATPDRAIPPKLAIPLLEGAALEDNDDLQDRWANLLVNAAKSDSGIELRRVYIEILSQISPLEAQVLDKIYGYPQNAANPVLLYTAGLPDSVQAVFDPASSTNTIGLTGEVQKLESTSASPSDEIVLALANLQRLGCVRAGGTYGGGESFNWINQTLLGRSFVEACQLRKAP